MATEREPLKLILDGVEFSIPAGHDYTRVAHILAKAFVTYTSKRLDFTPAKMKGMVASVYSNEALSLEVAKLHTWSRCRVTATALDGPCPYEVRCTLEQGHSGLHCSDHGGFGFSDEQANR